MGPRMFHRGKASVHARNAALTTASMGPRMFHRGKRNLLSVVVPPMARFNGAADVSPRKASDLARILDKLG